MARQRRQKREESEASLYELDEEGSREVRKHINDCKPCRVEFLGLCAPL